MPKIRSQCYINIVDKIMFLFKRIIISHKMTLFNFHKYIENLFNNCLNLLPWQLYQYLIKSTFIKIKGTE
jgi:hypothetical protein